MPRPDLCTSCQKPLEVYRNSKNAPGLRCVNPSCPKKAANPAAAPATEKAPVPSAQKVSRKKVRKQAPPPVVPPTTPAVRKRGFFSL